MIISMLHLFHQITQLYCYIQRDFRHRLHLRTDMNDTWGALDSGLVMPCPFANLIVSAAHQSLVQAVHALPQEKAQVAADVCY